MTRFLLLIMLALSMAGQAAATEDAAPGLGAVWILDLDGAVGPATSDYLLRGLEDAAQREARLVIIRMNTPGGLDGAMRDIIRGILASEVPVASFVAPKGARAASAGTYILYASHIAAMAPATNLGAATPVSIGPSGALPQSPNTNESDDPAQEPAAAKTAMEKKMVNDAAAYIRGLAELRQRNSEWAELAVREAVSLSSSEALELQVIDIVADNVLDLLDQLQDRTIMLDSGEVSLDVVDAPIYEAAPDWRTEFLATITNPNLVLILGMIGFYGIILEFYNPGSLVPGTIGVICLLLAAYSLQLLPVNYAGLALLLVGIGLMIAEAMAPSFGILGIGGVIAFTFGGIIGFDTDIDAFRVGWPLLLTFGLVTAGMIIATISLAMRMRAQPVKTGVAQLLGKSGEALDDFDHEGMVRVEAEIWRAQSSEPIRKGDRITVTDVNGLSVNVTRINS